MFSTELREKRYIPIVDVSAAAFKEFLQFFYLTKVELTTENIVQVTKLCKKFGLIEFLGGSDILHQHLTSNNNLCWGYEFYIFLKHDNYIKNCEEKIKENAVGVLKSPCFLECDQKIFAKVLYLISNKCSGFENVDACMEWAKTECKRKNLEENPKNLRILIDETFDHISFNKLNPEQLFRFIKSYKGFFTGEELETLIEKTIPTSQEPSEKVISTPESTHFAQPPLQSRTIIFPSAPSLDTLYPTLPALPPRPKTVLNIQTQLQKEPPSCNSVQARRVLVCDRNSQSVAKCKSSSTPRYNSSSIRTTFIVNKSLVLSELYIRTRGYFEKIRLQYYHKNTKSPGFKDPIFTNYHKDLQIYNKHEPYHVRVVLSKPLDIEKGLYYHVEISKPDLSSLELVDIGKLEQIVRLDDGTEVKFQRTDSDVISRLIFHSYERYVIDHAVTNGF